MMDWNSGMGFGHGFGFLFWVLVIAAIFGVVFWAGPRAWRSERDAQSKSAIEILEERYARGEIGREEYEQKRRDLKA